MSKSLPKKEIILADADGDYLHAEKYEQSFYHDNHESIIYTSQVFKGKVKITIEEIES